MADPTRDRLETDEDARLAPWAVRARDATRRHALEDRGRSFDYRGVFQRDRDRIVYSRAFRRLRQKAQAGILPAYEDHRRNRLTHTLEVAQLARTVSRALRLNEDLTEAVALGHDLGQPPFGPTGERALDDVLAGRLDGRGGPGLGDLGGFVRPEQSLRVVDRLEKRYDHPGLNLSDPVREGLLKSAGGAAAGYDAEGVRPGLAPPFETQVVTVGDRIATALHDLDDALQSAALDVSAVERLAAVRELKRKLGREWQPRASRFMKANRIHRGLVHMMVTALIVQTGRTLERWAETHGVDGPERFAAVRDEAVRGDEVRLPPSAGRLLEGVEGLLEARVRRGREADQVEARGRRVVLGLFAAYHADPTLVADHLLIRFKEVAGVRFLRDLPRHAVADEVARRYRRDPRYAHLLADHLAAMTDAFALAEHERVFGMGAVPIPGVEQLLRESRQTKRS